MSKIRARRRRHTLERVCESPAALRDAAANGRQPGFEKDEIGRRTCHVDGALYRETRVGGMQCRRIVHAVAEQPDDVSGLLQRRDDALLLVRIDFDEAIGELHHVPERLVMERIELASGQHPLGP